jgi:hypothetical protein
MGRFIGCILGPDRSLECILDPANIREFITESFTSRSRTEKGTNLAKFGNGVQKEQRFWGFCIFSSVFPAVRQKLNLMRLTYRFPALKTREVHDEHHNGEPSPAERLPRESKLELFEVDPLVDVRGLKRYVPCLQSFSIEMVC